MFLGVLNGSGYEGRHRSVVLVSGDLDLSTCEHVRSRLFSAMDGPSGDLVVDLSRVSFIDARGLGLLVETDLQAKATGHRVVLWRPSQIVCRLLSLGGLGDHFELEFFEQD